ncbi:MAG: single-stranded DNA-binding protein [Candidatus Moraniibacteriota bacterium]
MNINKVILVGRLTRDPEVRTTATGQTVTSISLATNRFWKDKNGQKQDQTEFHNVVLWGKLGEIAGQYLTKGQEAFIEGRMSTRKYTGKDGVERRTTEVVAENMQLGSRAGQGGGQASGSYNKPAATPADQSQNQSSAADEIPTIDLDAEEDEVRIEDVPF